MVKVQVKTAKERRKTRTATGIHGTSDRPRLSVNRSNRYIYAQLIDDDARETLVTIDDVAKKAHEEKGVTKKQAAFKLGKTLAERATKKGIKEAVFDKGSYRFHGRVKNLAQGAREGGLKF
ncbi:50S ribosomal protein L18 [candidate division WWE3 bacterium]|nr:50S ribosomal protein L18 [candidate division WWE3 bacterium]